jgi:hypothetical protein
MPVIVYKTLNLNVLYVQGRRILCEFCRTPFSYIVGDRKTFNVTGVPIVSSDDGMRKEASKKAAAGLARVAREKNAGQALCPHCKRYQRWMVSHSRMTGMGCGFLGGIAIAGLLAIFAGSWFGWGSEVMLGLTVAGAVAGIVIGKLASLDVGPHQKEDQRALRDEDVPGFLQHCSQGGYEPFLFWYLAMGNKAREKEALISLGIADVSGRPPVFPRELSSDMVVRQLQQA